MLPTFPSRYWFTIGLLRVFSLAGWSPRIQTGFHVSRPTQVALLNHALYLYRTLTVFGQTFQIVPIRNMVSFERSYNPTDASTTVVWALSLSIATTREIDLFFLFLRVLRCFSSPGWPHQKSGARPSTVRVAPFGHPRIKTCLRFTGAFRSLPRPSSPAEA